MARDPSTRRDKCRILRRTVAITSTAGPITLGMNGSERRAILDELLPTWHAVLSRLP
jgi:hypothetical protein